MMSRTWIEPWGAVCRSQKGAIHAECRRTLRRQHPLFGIKLEAIGRRFGTQEVLFRTDHNRLVVVNLTSLKNSGLDEGTLEFFPGWTAFASQKMAVDSLNE